MTCNGADDVFVAKVKASMAGLVYCGYIGGSGNDVGWAIAADGSGGAYVTGYAASAESSFPVIVGPDLTFNGGSTDVYVAKVAEPPLRRPRHAAGDFDGDDVSELAVDFGAAGVWSWDGYWNQLSGANADYLAACDLDGNGSDELVGDFGTAELSRARLLDLFFYVRQRNLERKRPFPGRR